MNELEKLQKEIEKIKERNKKVEADKAWETSTLRKVTIALVTYFFITMLMMILEITDPFISAIIPTAGYLLSTLSIGVVKTWWLKRRNN
jgi:hypothetical protein